MRLSEAKSNFNFANLVRKETRTMFYVYCKTFPSNNSPRVIGILTNLLSMYLCCTVSALINDSRTNVAHDFAGFLMNKAPGVHQPKKVENAKILIANTPMDTDKIKIFGSRVKVAKVSEVAEIELAEKEKMKDKVELICKHDINVFINRQLIYNYPEQLFADKGVMAIEHADFDGIERLALVTGGEIVSTFGNPELVKVIKSFAFPEFCSLTKFASSFLDWKVRSD
jgi:hypothetical protein